MTVYRKGTRWIAQTQIEPGRTKQIGTFNSHSPRWRGKRPGSPAPPIETSPWQRILSRRFAGPFPGLFRPRTADLQPSRRRLYERNSDSA